MPNIQYEFVGLRMASGTLIIEVNLLTKKLELLPISASPVIPTLNHKNDLYTEWSFYNSMCKTVLY